uniref:Si:dkeyp-11e3.1 n=1 Tax=Neolamprologus brichardi TaxID=32507 RepID=A0A3Q4I2C1_NEOBR
MNAKYKNNDTRRTDSPIAVSVEEHSNFVILTYFQGDINSMVDAHFNRALKKDYSAKESAIKTKKHSKTIKLGESINLTLHGFTLTAVSQFYLHSLTVSPASRLLTITAPNNTSSSWSTFPTRAGEGPGLSSIAYSLSPDGLSLTGQQYASSLLNLLHSDRGEMGPVASSSKPELLPSWTIPQGFRESVDPAVAFEPGNSAAVIQNVYKSFHTGK